MKFQGFDLALNHSATVRVDECGEVDKFYFITSNKRIAKTHSKHATLFDTKYERARAASAQQYKIDRLLNFSYWLKQVISPHEDLRVAIENYSFGSKTNSAYEIGEFGGVIRDYLNVLNLRYRLWSPNHIKNFAGIGKSEKPVKFCSDELGVDWAPYDCGLKSSQSSGDLADAHILALLAMAEHKRKTNQEVPKRAQSVLKYVEGCDWLGE